MASMARWQAFFLNHGDGGHDEIIQRGEKKRFIHAKEIQYYSSLRIAAWLSEEWGGRRAR